MKTYAEYKNSGIPWIGEIPKGWEVKPFSSNFTFGKGLPITKKDLVQEGVPVISYGQIHSKNNTGTTISRELLRFVSPDFLVSNPNCLLQKCDFVFADTSEDIEGSGNCAFIDIEEKVFAGYHTIIARPKDKSSAQYLAHLFQSKNWKSQIQCLVNGVKVYSIGKTILKKSTILCPSPAEQRAIVAFLEKKTKQINDCIALRERELQTLNELKQAQIAQVVTKGLNHSAPMKDSGIPWIGEIPEHWEVNKINRLFKLIGSGTTPKGENCYTTENDGIPWINSGDLNYSILYKSKYYLTKETVANNTTLKIFPKGTLMIAMYGASIGKYAISQIDACTNQACCNLYGLQSNMNINYVSFLMNPCKTKWIEDSIGGTQPNISAEKIKQTWIPVPPLSEQTAIVQYLDNCTQTINSYISHLEKEIEHLKEYKQRLISDVVTGKIDVRDEA